MGNPTKYGHSHDVVEKWPVTKYITTNGINANDQSTGMHVYHGEDAHEQHQLVARLLTILLAQEHAKTGHVEKLMDKMDDMLWTKLEIGHN